MKIFSRTTLFAAFIGLTLAGCSFTSLPYMKEETAQRLASAAWMVGRDVPAGPMHLRAFERMHEKREPANVYIGFDSPNNPVTLHLATKDNADNLAYIAQPCRYTNIDDCAQKFGGSKAYSDETVQAYSAALDEMGARYDLEGFHLIGYSGGAAIAALLAEKRSDVLSIRSVAGILDTDTYAAFHGKIRMSGSTNPTKAAAHIKDIPQFHFIGGKDGQVPPAVLHGYLQAMPQNNCVHSLMIQEATHDKGWVDKWPELLKLPLSCYMKTESLELPVGTTLPTFKPDFGKALKKKTKHKISSEKPVKP